MNSDESDEVRLSSSVLALWRLDWVCLAFSFCLLHISLLCNVFRITLDAGVLIQWDLLCIYLVITDHLI
jgi:hypothetical protein